MLFQFSSMGRVQQSLDALVDGISEVLRKSGGNGERLLPWVSGEERLVEVVSRCFLQVWKGFTFASLGLCNSKKIGFLFFCFSLWDNWQVLFQGDLVGASQCEGSTCTWAWKFVSHDCWDPRKQNLLVRSSHVWKKHLVHVDYNLFQFLGSAVTGLFQCLPHASLVTSRVRTPQIPYSVGSGPPMLDKELSPVQGGNRGGKLHTSSREVIVGQVSSVGAEPLDQKPSPNHWLISWSDET